MSYYESDVYYQPEDFGLTQIGQLDDPEASYSFDYLIVWKHEDGRVFWATDAGCSCPSPFEDYTSLDDLTLVTNENWAEFQKEVEGHCIPKQYNYDTRQYPDPQAADKVDLLRKVAALL